MRARAAFLLGTAAAILLGSALRLHTLRQATETGRIRPLDSDSAYHMRRARFAAAHFPRTIQFDPLMNFPEGGVAIWPPLFDLALAAPAYLANGPQATPEAVARGAAWVPVALAALGILLAGLLGREVIGEGGGALCAVFLAVCPGHILWSQFAHTDQHVAESVCGLAVLWTFVRSRERPESPGDAGREPSPGLDAGREPSSGLDARREAAAGLCLAVAVVTWQGAIYWAAIVAASLVGERVLTRRSVARAAAWTLGAPAAVTAAATAAWLGWLRPPLTYISFGFFQPLFVAALAGGVAALDLVLGWRGADLRARRLSAAIAVAAAAATLPFARELWAGLFNGLGYAVGKTHEVAGALGYLSYPKNWLAGIFETRPLLSDGPGLALRQLSAAFFLAPVAVALWASRAIRGERTGVHVALTVWGAVTLFLACAQRLNVYYAAPLAALAVAEAARLAAAYGRLGASSPPSPGGPLRARLTAAGVALLLMLPMARGLAEELRAVHAPGSDLFDTLDRMRLRLPRAIDAYDPRLLGPPPFPAELAAASAVLAPWSLGHFILYEAERPVVANNFGYGFLDSIRFFLSESDREAFAIARRRRARWILAADLAPRMNDYASYLGRPPYFGRVASPAYFETMQARLYEFDGKGASLPGLEVAPVPGVRLLFHSRSAIRRGDRWLALWKVFEIENSELRVENRDLRIGNRGP